MRSTSSFSLYACGTPTACLPRLIAPWPVTGPTRAAEDMRKQCATRIAGPVSTSFCRPRPAQNVAWVAERWSSGVASFEQSEHANHASRPPANLLLIAL
jgi:hypothetical protein